MDNTSRAMPTLLKLILAGLLFLCLLDMPYGYFQLVRFVSMAVFVYLAYDANTRDENGLVFVYIALALLFQPFFKVHLGRTLWNVVDVAVGVWLVISAIGGKESPKAT